LLEVAVSGNPYFGTISPEWQDVPKDYAQHLPLATVRVGPQTTEDEFYGRQVGTETWSGVSEGEMKSWDFSIYCFASACKESGEDSNKYVQQFANQIKSYLQSDRRALTDYAIEDIYDLRLRESNVRDIPRNVRRIIVEGSMWARSLDDKRYLDGSPYYESVT